MAALIYIPTHDPFAVFSIILLFALIITSLILLIFIARYSAHDDRKAVRDQARYQRLRQVQRKEERLYVKMVEEGKGKGKLKSGPAITITAPSIASWKSSSGELRTATMGRNNPYRNVASVPDDGDASTAATSLLSSSGPKYRSEDSLPPTLRIGQR